MFCMLIHALHGDHGEHPSTASNSNESLLDVLKHRYALGEINNVQFEQMKRTLGLAFSSQSNMPTEHTGHSEI